MTSFTNLRTDLFPNSLLYDHILQSYFHFIRQLWFDFSSSFFFSFLKTIMNLYMLRILFRPKKYLILCEKFIVLKIGLNQKVLVCWLVWSRLGDPTILLNYIEYLNWLNCGWFNQLYIFISINLVQYLQPCIVIWSSCSKTHVGFKWHSCIP